MIHHLMATLNHLPGWYKVALGAVGALILLYGWMAYQDTGRHKRRVIDRIERRAYNRTRQELEALYYRTLDQMRRGR